MTENKRPWTADVEAYRFVGKPTYSYLKNSDGLVVAVVHTGEADARLFVAAPELYEALEAIVQAEGKEDGDGSFAAFFAAENARMKAARAALRAANPDAFESEVGVR